MVYNASDIINWTAGPEIILTHAGPATNYWFGWIATFSIWLIIFMAIYFAEERKWAVAAASFIGMIIATVGLVFSWNNEALVILQIVLFVAGISAGFVA